MLYLKIILIALVLVHPSVLSVTNAEFEGKRPTEYSQLLQLADRLSQTNVPDDAVQDSVEIWLVENGYLDAVIANSDGSMLIRAGEQTRLVRLILKTDSAVSLDIDLPFTPANCRKSVDQILRPFQEIGYYFARAIVDSVAKNDYEATLFLSLNPGPIVTTEGSRFEGLSFTSEDVVERLIGLPDGTVINQNSLRETQSAANSLEFITFEPPIEILPRPGYTKAMLKYRFHERKRFSIFGGGGYSPNESTGLLWQLRVTAMNFLGEGRLVRLHSQQREQNRQTLEIAYQQPLFWLGSGWLEIDILSRDFRDDFSEFATRIGMTTRISGGTSAGINLGFKRVEMATDQTGYTRYDAGLSLKRSTVVDDFNPRRGFQLATSLTYSHRRHSSPDQTDPTNPTEGHVFNDTRAQLRFDYYLPIVTDVLLWIKASYAGFETNESAPPLSELYLVGGPGSLRGYRNDQYATERKVLVTTEPRFRFEQGYLFVFYDMAYLSRTSLSDEVTDSDKELFGGYGLGLALRNQSTSLKLSAGWKPGANFDQPRLSVTLQRDL